MAVPGALTGRSSSSTTPYAVPLGWTWVRVSRAPDALENTGGPSVSSTTSTQGYSATVPDVIWTTMRIHRRRITPASSTSATIWVVISRNTPNGAPSARVVSSTASLAGLASNGGTAAGSGPTRRRRADPAGQGAARQMEELLDLGDRRERSSPPSGCRRPDRQ